MIPCDVPFVFIPPFVIGVFVIPSTGFPVVPDPPGLVAPVLGSMDVLYSSPPVAGAVGAPVPPALKPESLVASASVAVLADAPVDPGKLPGLVKMEPPAPVVPSLPAMEVMGTGVVVTPVVKGSLRKLRVVPRISLLDVILVLEAAELRVTSVIAVSVLNTEVAIVVETVNVAFVGAVSLHSNSPAMQ